MPALTALAWFRFGGRYRGLVPRATQQMVWGTAMVSLYEALRRYATIDGPNPDEATALR